MRLLTTLLVFVSLAAGLSAQIGTGQWRLHVPSKNALDVVQVGNKIYAAFPNGMSEYDKNSNELSVWDAVNGLSDITVSCLGKSTSNGSVFIGYENGNIDKLKGNTVTNIPAIKLAEVQGSKKIYKMVEYNDHVFCATGFAIVKIDPVKNEVRDTYYPTNGNQAIVDIAFDGDTIFALTPDKMYKGDLNNFALADPNEWILDTRVDILSTNAYHEMETVNNELYILMKVDGFGLDTVYQVTPTGLINTVTETSTPMEVTSIDNLDGKLAFNFSGGTIIYTSTYGYDLIINQFPFAGTVRAKRTIYDNGTYWIADGESGLVKFGGGPTQAIAFSGPPKNDFYRMDWQDGRLAVVSGGVTDVIQAYNSEGMYIFEDENWSLKSPHNMNLWAGTSIYDFLGVSINPKDKEQMAVGTYSQMPLSIIDASGQVVDTFTYMNSGLEQTNVGIGQTLVSDVSYDADGNLWVLNGGTNNPLKVYTKDQEWQMFDVGTAAKGLFSRKLIVDQNKHKWFSFRDSGLYGYNDNGTPMDPSDDHYIILRNGDNQGGLPSNEVTALAADYDNEIWIGTDNGFAILYNSSSSLDPTNTPQDAQRIKLNFEGNVEFLLGATHITDIEVDGANRKWFGTANAGIILLSADGQEIIEQHTVDNSPLISNNIIDLQLDHNTGELFIITDQGLVSYRTDATIEDASYSNVKVFPNPARPDFDGVITIQGIRYDSDVKVTDAAGNLVYQTTSNGGTATWNARTVTGERVKTGVYLIWTAPNEGKGRKVGKVLVVN